MQALRHQTPAQRSFLGAGVLVLGLLAFGLVGLSESSIARADAIGVMDPVAAEVCGGSYHDPNCPPELLGGACCALFSLAVAGLGFSAASRGRASGPREGVD